MRKKLFFFLLVLSFFVNISKVSAQVNKLIQDFDVLTITKQKVYTSKTDNKSIDEILRNDQLLTSSKKILINSGPLNHYNWLRIDVQNQSNLQEFIFEANQTYIDSLELFIVKNDKILKQFPKKGLYFKENNNPSYFTNKYAYTYNISIVKGDTISLYLNAVVNDGAFKVVNKLWSKEKYKSRIKEIQFKTFYLNFFGGFVSLVLLLSIMMYIFSRQVMYLYYAGFVLATYLNLMVLRYFVSPLYVEYLFFGNNFSEMFGYLQLFLMLQYFIYFFNLKKNYLKLNSFINHLSIFIIVFYVLALYMRKFDWFYSFSFYFSKILMMFTTIFLYIITAFLIIKKHRMAFYFAIAYAPLVFLITHFIMTSFGLTNSYNPLEWEFVIFFEILMLTMAMTHNYYLLTQENMANLKRIYTQKLKISRDLHDNIGSQLTFIKSSVDNLNYLTNFSDKELKNKLNKISQFSSNTINQLRDTVWALNKKDITLNDLSERIQNLKEKAYVADSKLQFRYSCKVKSTPIFSSIKGVNIFRVIQESVNNALKYAKATTLHIEISEDKKHLKIQIIDNGIGFDIKKIKNGNGLNNMQVRIEEIKEELIIDSRMDKGTNITILVKK